MTDKLVTAIIVVIAVPAVLVGYIWGTEQALRLVSERMKPRIRPWLWLLPAWRRAWMHGKEAQNARELAVVNRAAAELAYLYARLGRMAELDALLKSLGGRMFFGGATEKINGAREALWTMQNRPEIAFRCGPLALHRIKLATDPEHAATAIIYESASTQKGLSLAQVVELSRKIGLNYQMAFREKGAATIGVARGILAEPFSRDDPHPYRASR